MKKLALVAALALAAAAASAQATAPLASNQGFVILNNLALYVEKGGGLEYKEALTIGDRVQYMGGLSKFKVDGAEREYVRVKAPSGTEGWARSTYIVQRAAMAVVRTEDAILYSEPREIKVTASTVSYMTLVASLLDTSGTFAKIVCYDTVQNKYYTEPIFIAREDLTFADTDINAVVNYAVASASKSKEIRAALFKNIQRRYMASIFFDTIAAALNPAPVVSAGGKATVPATGRYLVTEDKVNVRATPDEKAGEIVTQLNKGTKVEAVEATVEQSTIGGRSAVWYRLKDPAGWIFGGFVVPAE